MATMRCLETGPAWTTVHADDIDEAKVEVAQAHEIIVETQDDTVGHQAMTVTSGESVLAVRQVETRKGSLIEGKSERAKLVVLGQKSVSVRNSNRINVIGHLKFATQLKNNSMTAFF